MENTGRRARRPGPGGKGAGGQPRPLSRSGGENRRAHSFQRRKTSPPPADDPFRTPVRLQRRQGDRLFHHIRISPRRHAAPRRSGGRRCGPQGKTGGPYGLRQFHGCAGRRFSAGTGTFHRLPNWQDRGHRYHCGHHGKHVPGGNPPAIGQAEPRSHRGGIPGGDQKKDGGPDSRRLPRGRAGRGRAGARGAGRCPPSATMRASRSRWPTTF